MNEADDLDLRHQNEVAKGGAIGFGLGLATSLPASYLLHRRWPYYRALPPSLKALGVVMVVAPWTVIEAERRSMAYEEEQRKKRKGYVDPHLEEEIQDARRQLLSPKDRALDWLERRRYSVVGGSWALSIAGELRPLHVLYWVADSPDPNRCFRYHYAQSVSLGFV